MRVSLTKNEWTEVSSNAQNIQNIGNQYIIIQLKATKPDASNRDGVEIEPSGIENLIPDTSDKIWAFTSYDNMEVEIFHPNITLAWNGSKYIPLLCDTEGRIKTNSTGDFFLDVAKGDIDGYSCIEKFGENPDIDTGTYPEDVWDGGGIYTFSSTADISKIASSDSGDTQDIQIFGLDENWNEVTQTIELTGQTPVTLETPLIRVYRMINRGSTDIGGTVYLAISTATWTSGVPDTDTDIRAVINNGNNQTLMCIYSVPAGKTAYFYQGYVAYGKSSSTGASFTWRARLFGEVFAVKSKVAVIGSGSSSWAYLYKVPLALPEKSDVLIRCEMVEANNTDVSGGFTVLLIDN